jgi:SPP1 gp7 family putative phage head morphogenesis protein
MVLSYYNERKVIQQETRMSRTLNTFFTRSITSIPNKYQINDALEHALITELNRPVARVKVSNNIYDVLTLGIMEADESDYRVYAAEDVVDEYRDIALIEYLIAVLFWSSGKNIMRDVSNRFYATYTVDEIAKMTVHQVQQRLLNVYNDSFAHRTGIVARTLVNDIYNYAVIQTNIDSGIDYFQFQAVIDHRTSDICRMLHGSIFPASVAQYYRPPLHYRCRSRMVALQGNTVRNTGMMFDNRNFSTLYDGNMRPYTSSTVTPTVINQELQRMNTFRQRWDLPEDLLYADYSYVRGN